MKLSDKVIVNVTLNGEYAESYKYLISKKVKCAEILKYKGQQGIYEKAREMKFRQRQVSENNNNVPF